MCNKETEEKQELQEKYK